MSIKHAMDEFEKTLETDGQKSLWEEFKQLRSESMTLGERYSNEGQAKLDRFDDLRDLLGLWNKGF